MTSALQRWEKTSNSLHERIPISYIMADFLSSSAYTMEHEWIWYVTGSIQVRSGMSGFSIDIARDRCHIYERNKCTAWTSNTSWVRLMAAPVWLRLSGRVVSLARLSPLLSANPWNQCLHAVLWHQPNADKLQAGKHVLVKTEQVYRKLSVVSTFYWQFVSLLSPDVMLHPLEESQQSNTVNKSSKSAYCCICNSVTGYVDQAMRDSACANCC